MKSSFRLISALVLALSSLWGSVASANACALEFTEMGKRLYPYLAESDAVALDAKTAELEAKAAGLSQNLGSPDYQAAVLELSHVYAAAGRPVEAAWALESIGKSADASALMDGMVKTLNDAKIAGEKNLGGGITETQLIDYQAGFKGVFKPEAQSGSNNWASHWQHEIAAYKLDRMLGIGIVPPTTDAVIAGRHGSVQYFVKNATMGGAKSWRLQFLDYVVSNLDRHGGNYLRRGNGQVIAIDHGLAFGAYQNNAASVNMADIMPTKSMYAKIKANSLADYTAQIRPLLVDAYETLQRAAPDKKNNPYLKPMLDGQPGTQFDATMNRLNTWIAYVDAQVAARGDAAFRPEGT